MPTDERLSQACSETERTVQRKMISAIFFEVVVVNDWIGF